MNTFGLFKKNVLTVVFLFLTFILSIVSAGLISHNVLTTSRAKGIGGAIIHTSYGDVTIAFRDDTPKTVENFIRLTQLSFYNNTKFHRIVNNLLIQGGDPLSKFDALRAQWGKGSAGYIFPLEVHDYDRVVRGNVLMVSSDANNSNSSQFFIMVNDADWLNKQNTIFADVVSGMDVVDKISKLQVGITGIPQNDVEIEGVTLY